MFFKYWKLLHTPKCELEICDKKQHIRCVWKFPALSFFWKLEIDYTTEKYFLLKMLETFEHLYIDFFNFFLLKPNSVFNFFILIYLPILEVS